MPHSPPSSHTPLTPALYSPEKSKDRGNNTIGARLNRVEDKVGTRASPTPAPVGSVALLLAVVVLRASTVPPTAALRSPGSVLTMPGDKQGLAVHWGLGSHSSLPPVLSVDTSRQDSVVRAHVHSTRWAWVPMGRGQSKSKLGWFHDLSQVASLLASGTQCPQTPPWSSRENPAHAGWAVRPQLRVAP